MFASTEEETVLTKLTSYDTSLPLKFTARRTKMFGNSVERFEGGHIAYNSHTWAIDPTKFITDTGLKKMFRMTSTNHDPKHNSTFAATIEGRSYPFFGTLFHPEK